MRVARDRALFCFVILNIPRNEKGGGPCASQRTHSNRLKNVRQSGQRVSPIADIIQRKKNLFLSMVAIRGFFRAIARSFFENFMSLVRKSIRRLVWGEIRFSIGHSNPRFLAGQTILISVLYYLLER